MDYAIVGCDYAARHPEVGARISAYYEAREDMTCILTAIGIGNSPMTRCHTCRLRHSPLALQWHPRRELAARQAERGTCARPTLIWVMQNTRESNAAAGRAAIFIAVQPIPKMRSSQESHLWAG